MFPFGGFLDFGTIAIFGIFFVINLIVQLVTGGLDELFMMPV